MTEHIPHPITLDTVFFTRCSVIAVMDHVPHGKLDVGPTNKFRVAKVEPNLYQAVMSSTMNLELSKEYPYSIDMECFADLRADATLTEEEAMRGVHITAHSVLYGAIRESVAWLTGRQIYGPLMLGLSVLRPVQAKQEEISEAKS